MVQLCRLIYCIFLSCRISCKIWFDVLKWTVRRHFFLCFSWASKIAFKIFLYVALNCYVPWTFLCTWGVKITCNTVKRRDVSRLFGYWIVYGYWSCSDTGCVHKSVITLCSSPSRAVRLGRAYCGRYEAKTEIPTGQGKSGTVSQSTASRLPTVFRGLEDTIELSKWRTA